MTSPRTPRQLPGWTVPGHVGFHIGTGAVHLNCLYPGCASMGATTRVWQIGPAGWDVGPWLTDHAHGETVERLSEVLPETPEPPRLTHDEARVAAIGQMKAAEQRREGVAAAEAERGAEHCYFEGCSEWITGSSDYCPEHAKLYAPVPASQSVPAVPVSSTGGKETGEAAETATEALRARLVEIVEEGNPLSSFGEIEATVDAVLTAFGRLPDSETEWASTAEIAGFLSTIMTVGNARGAAKFLDRGYRLTRREVTS